jgi:hypothetical protein
MRDYFLTFSTGVTGVATSSLSIQVNKAQKLLQTEQLLLLKQAQE